MIVFEVLGMEVLNVSASLWRRMCSRKMAVIASSDLGRGLQFCSARRWRVQMGHPSVGEMVHCSVVWQQYLSHCGHRWRELASEWQMSKLRAVAAALGREGSAGSTDATFVA